MSMPPVEVREVNGFTVRVEYDEYPDESSNPRDWDGSFLWLGFPHRHYDIGDERLDPSTFEIECRSCHGDGKIDIPETNHDHECPACNGYGRESAGNLAELIELVKHHYKARVVMPVGMIDHSGVAYYLGGGEHPHDPGGWDSGTCGLMLVTQEMLDKWGNTQTDDELIEGMRAEIAEYNAWCSGQVYDLAVIDRNGDEIERIGGYIGDDGIKRALEEGVSIAEANTPPESLYDVGRMTADELRAAAEGLIRHGHADKAAAILSPITVKEPT